VGFRVRKAKLPRSLRKGVTCCSVGRKFHWTISDNNNDNNYDNYNYYYYNDHNNDYNYYYFYNHHHHNNDNNNDDADGNLVKLGRVARMQRALWRDRWNPIQIPGVRTRRLLGVVTRL
jgi:hypothetical protein